MQYCSPVSSNPACRDPKPLVHVFDESVLHTLIEKVHIQSDANSDLQGAQGSAALPRQQTVNPHARSDGMLANCIHPRPSECVMSAPTKQTESSASFGTSTAFRKGLTCRFKSAEIILTRDPTFQNDDIPQKSLHD